MTAAWHGWRRPAGGHAPWEQVPGAAGATRAEAYDRLMERTELAGHAPPGGRQEYVICPAGVRPASHPARQAYRTRRMGPG